MNRTAAMCLSAAVALPLFILEDVASANPVCTPSRLMVVLDKSSSMQTGTINGTTKWQIASDALDTVVTEYENRIELGLTTFPKPNECSPGSLDVAPALGKRAEIMAALGSAPPTSGNWTPMAQTLEAVALEPTLVSTTSAKYAVLITDGWQWCSPYDPTMRFKPIDAIGSLNAAGVTTYVVGFGASADAFTLNQMAVTAGTAKAGCDASGDSPSAPNNCYYQADNPADLVQALMNIATSVSAETCDGLDNDCDGEVDENLTQACATDCGSGTETCVNGNWTGCDAPAVEAEICDGEDNNCDGAIDPGCDCAAGDTRECGGSETTGACSPGVQTCAADGTWGNCEGAVDPSSEMCDNLDNDCDGRTDEMTDDVGSLCGPGFDCVNGHCDEMEPVIPPGDDPEPDPVPAADDGEATSNCACSGGGDSRGAAGTMVLMLLASVFVARRRRS